MQILALCVSLYVSVSMPEALDFSGHRHVFVCFCVYVRMKCHKLRGCLRLYVMWIVCLVLSAAAA